MSRPISLNELNKAYIYDKRAAAEIKRSLDAISVKKDPDTDTMISYISEFKNIIQKYPPADQDGLSANDVIVLCDQFVRCIETINKYQRSLISYTISNKEIDEVVNEQKKLDAIKARFKSTHEIKSLNSVTHIMQRSLSALYSEKAKRIESAMQSAKDILNAEPIELKSDDDIKSGVALPAKLIVAKAGNNKTDLELLKDIGISSNQEPIYSDVQESGNIWVDYAPSNKSDADLNRFIVAYIMKFIESFPLGAAQVSIVDKNPAAVYSAMVNVFQNDANGDNARDTVRIFDKLKPVIDRCRQHSNDVFVKFKETGQTLFDLYDTDQSDHFELVILKNGISERDYSSSEIQDSIKSLTLPKEQTHRCGIRFLIVNEIKPDDRERTKEARIIDEIKKNCEIVLNYKNGKFMYKDNSVECLKVNGDIETYVRIRASKLAELINLMKKDRVEINDISSNAPTSGSFNDDILYIPVGKSGEDTVNLPFSCNNSNSSSEGSCIGYMVIGASGSGKSSLLHSIVINGSYKYSPNDLNFWLLDFKDGSSSSKYETGAPHIKYIAARNKVEDADGLFQMILEEMTKRTNSFNTKGVHNIVEYNERSNEHLPRIIIIIDEVQEIFNDSSNDYYDSIKSSIASISSRMRSTGMHFVMIAQNLSVGRSNVLTDIFMPSASGRICFRVDSDALSQSGFKQGFRDHQDEIATLKVGEAFISYNSGASIKKVKISYASSDEICNIHLKKIREKYPNIGNTKVIGAENKLSISDKLQGCPETYYDIISQVRKSPDRFVSIIGEDVYRMEPVRVEFSTDQNSSLIFAGTNKSISASLCSSVALAVSKKNTEVYTFNANRDELFIKTRKLLENNALNCKPPEFRAVIGELYAKHIERQNDLQYLDDDETPNYSPIFLIVNDYYAIDAVKTGETVELNLSSYSSQPSDLEHKDYYLSPAFGDDATDDPKESFTIDDIMNDLLNEGYKSNIHIVLSVSTILQRGQRSNFKAAETILFNDCDPDQLPFALGARGGRLKGLLESIQMPFGDETLAIRISRGDRFSKIRPLIYNHEIKYEMELLEKLIRSEK